MSLIENDMDLDNRAGTSNIQYPSLAVELQQDDDIKKAIELSLAANSESCVKEPVVLTTDELRDKRLKRFEIAVNQSETSNKSDKKDEEEIEQSASKKVCQKENK